MALSNPIEAWLQAARSKTDNQRQMDQDISGIGQGLGDSFNSIGSYMKAQKQKELLQKIIQAMNTQGSPAQGPQMPPIQGPAGYAPPNQGPNSTAVPSRQSPTPLGAPQDNRQQMKQLIAQYDPQGAVQLMEGQLFANPPSALQQSEVGLNNAKIEALKRGPQPKPTNPLDDAIKQRRAKVLDAILKRMQNQPLKKPVNPVPAAALDVRTQIANNQQAPWYKKLGLAGGLKPVVNPLKGKATQASDISQMSDEELLKLVSQDDSQ